VGRRLGLPAASPGGGELHRSDPRRGKFSEPGRRTGLSEAKNITCLIVERLLHGPLRYGYCSPVQLPGYPFSPALPTLYILPQLLALRYLATSRLLVATVSPFRFSPSPAPYRCPFSDCLATWPPRYRLLLGPPPPPPRWSPWSTSCPRFGCLSTPPHSPAHTST
jgi:hypothetical protein